MESIITLYEVDQMALSCDLTAPEVLINLYAQGWGAVMSEMAHREAVTLYFGDGPAWLEKTV